MLNGFLSEQSLRPAIFYIISQDVTVLISQAMPHTASGEPAGTVESLINNPYRSLILWFILLSLLLELWFMAPRGQFWKIIYQLKHPDGGTFKVKVEAPETEGLQMLKSRIYVSCIYFPGGWSKLRAHWDQGHGGAAGGTWSFHVFLCFWFCSVREQAPASRSWDLVLGLWLATLTLGKRSAWRRSCGLGNTPLYGF